MKGKKIGKRIWIVGPPGAGKSTLAQILQDKLKLQHYELDSYFWMKNWTKVGQEEFENSVKFLAQSEKWVIDGQYSSLHKILLECADTVIWLDVKRPKIMFRIIKRAFRRLIQQEVLWNGNREHLKNAMNFFSYTYKVYPEVKTNNQELFENLNGRSVTCIRIQSSKELDDFLKNYEGKENWAFN
ncbi:AAA family ATPase [Bacillus cereus group sp. N21]|uniref:AAA family ATPase n=1 Tax=Bacillus cereus group sp. N21 TaxID=2794591 RepID=UPI0018F5A220|nr:AAA family ATPase [Bacillus cereus group sp. N21]MBJ8030411.1 AAA family ATPase [Bacillus cereus group sp. N21]